MKRTLFFADLSYINEGREWTIVPLPLSVAYIAAYAQKMLPGSFDIRLFKHPQRFLDAITAERPDMVAFSNYIWNRNLQLGFARHLKALHPGCVTVMGGPNYNFAETAWIDAFARAHPEIDFHVDGEGETKFHNIAACALAHDFDATAMKAASPAGSSFVDPADGRLVCNGLEAADGVWNCLDAAGLDVRRGRLLDLGEIPSPYLTGLLDDFLADPDFCPIVETNRGCPYSCTFCNWGAMGKSKSAIFPEDRVIEELRFIARANLSRTPYLYLGDSNFGLFKRDVRIANLLRELKDSEGFPQNVYMYFAKNSSENVVRISEILKDMTPVTLSRQSQNAQVLDAIKRSNISTDTFNNLAGLAKSLGVTSCAELIFGLPDESKESFYAGVRDVLGQSVEYVHIFPTMLLDGAEMGTAASRALYGMKGEWRLIDGCAGVYGPVAAMEFEEIVTSTNAMSRDDYIEIRLFHFLQALFFDTNIYKDVGVLLGEAGLVDFILDIIDHLGSAPAPLAALVAEFRRRAEDELMAEPPRRFERHEIAEAMARSVKLNPLFIAKLLFDPGVRDAFHDLLEGRILARGSATEEEVEAVFDYINATIYAFDGAESTEATLRLDAPGFARRGRRAGGGAGAYLLDAPSTFRFVKPFTYMNFIDEMAPDLPLSEKVYAVLVHHTHEEFGATLQTRLADAADGATVPAEAPGERVIREEGGWLY